MRCESPFVFPLAFRSVFTQVFSFWAPLLERSPVSDQYCVRSAQSELLSRLHLGSADVTAALPPHDMTSISKKAGLLKRSNSSCKNKKQISGYQGSVLKESTQDYYLPGSDSHTSPPVTPGTWAVKDSPGSNEHSWPRRKEIP